ncbi:hypothetical protein OG693_39470 (plasmid) [Streptomyces sp. NBC_01259]|uniref:hypothetical protein n=1 Tax=Streptomyces sp. NBC_01259 TaxID=2903800 RepID=UPI002F90F339
MNPNDQAALRLLAELQRLADPTQPAAVRVTIRSAEGDYIGDAVLPTPAAGHAVQAVSAMADYATRRPADFTPVPDTLDPLLVAAIEDHFADVDPASYLADVFSSPDAEASIAAYEQLVDGDWDGGVL